MTVLNRHQFAELLGVTGPTVRQWVKSGMPAERPGTAGNAPVEIDSVAAIRWLIHRLGARVVACNRSGGEFSTAIKKDAGLKAGCF
ncbi:MAG: terminase small subunit [Candidatus Contendobacter sp.]|nr:terminase small subunit [Candidatus Contendobacter sp.]